MRSPASARNAVRGPPAGWPLISHEYPQKNTDQAKYGTATSGSRRRQKSPARGVRPRYWYTSTNPVSAKKASRVKCSGASIAFARTSCGKFVAPTT